MQWNTSVAMITTLLDAKADIEARDMLGRTSLMWAGKLVFPWFSKLLIERNADVNAKDNGGSSVLAIVRAVDTENEEQEVAQNDIIERLVQAGAVEVSGKVHSGNTDKKPS